MPLQNLTGSEESTADTLRYWLASQYAALPMDDPVKRIGIAFISEGGINTTNQPLTDNDIRIQHKEQAVFVQLKDGDTETTDQSPNITFGNRTTYIDIFGKHAYSGTLKNLELIRDWVDNLLQQSARKQQWQQATEDSEGNHQTSSITGFKNYSCDWVRIQADQESGIIDQLSGEIETYFQRNN